eukprot:SAG25_NODE_74_length_16997_cov_287.503166_9_plen_182_part_00
MEPNLCSCMVFWQGTYSLRLIAVPEAPICLLSVRREPAECVNCFRFGSAYTKNSFCREKGLYSSAALMTAAGSLLGACSCSLAARRLVLLIAPTREWGGRPVAPYLLYPKSPSGLVATCHQHHHTPMCHFIRENLTLPPIQWVALTLHRGKSVNIRTKSHPRTILEMALRYLLSLAIVADY